MKKYVVLNENIWVDFILQEGFFYFMALQCSDLIPINARMSTSIYKMKLNAVASH